MTVDRDGYVRDLLEVCDLWFRGLDMLDQYLPSDDSDLVAPLLGAPMLIDSILRELMGCKLTAAEQSAVGALKKRLQDRREAIILSQPDGSEEPVRH
ncbi:hypothetical protein [Novosphingobium resinovorum]|uniref:hypothetical protein n=1 Tax=Novosphingobium resinovorum TaxID=158500 RepID=UPI002ED2C53E|nr:hypothetical protein [Novosphingobium resinovorum]